MFFMGSSELGSTLSVLVRSAQCSYIKQKCFISLNMQWSLKICFSIIFKRFFLSFLNLLPTHCCVLGSCILKGNPVLPLFGYSLFVICAASFFSLLFYWHGNILGHRGGVWTLFKCVVLQQNLKWIC